MIGGEAIGDDGTGAGVDQYGQPDAWDPFGNLMRVGGDGRVGNWVPRQSNETLYSATALVNAAMTRTKTLNGEVDAAVKAGRTQGYAEGQQQAQQELARELHRLQREMNNYQRLFEATIVDIAIAAAENTLKVQLDPETTRKMAADRIAEHAGSHAYAIYAASDAMPELREMLNAFRADHPGMPVPELHVDPRLQGDRAVLRTEFGSVDLDIRSQLNAIRHQLETPEMALSA